MCELWWPSAAAQLVWARVVFSQVFFQQQRWETWFAVGQDAEYSVVLTCVRAALFRLVWWWGEMTSLAYTHSHGHSVTKSLGSDFKFALCENLTALLFSVLKLGFTVH